MASALSQPEAAEESIVRELVARVDWRHAFEAVFLFLIFAGLLAMVQYSTPAPVGNDGYYHIRLADIMRQQGLALRVRFIWLPKTILNEAAYYDHHMLYHAILALFIPGAPHQAVPDSALLNAAKVSSVVIPALAYVAIWWLLDRQGVPWASIWAMGLFAVSDGFLFRMSMVRAQAASLLALALGLHWLLHRQWWPLLLLGFAYVWLYNAFPLLLLVAGVVVVARLIGEGRFEWQALVFPAAGIGLGMLINPYFPQDIQFIVRHLLPKIAQPETNVGNEWFPYETWTIVENSTLALALCGLGAFAVGWRRQRMSVPTLIAMLLAAVFGLMFLKSRRFVEYFPAFALIFGALSISPLVDRWALSIAATLHHGWQRVRAWREHRDPATLVYERPPNLQTYAEMVVPGMLALILILPLFRAMLRARDLLADQKPAAVMADAADWLEENAPPGAMIFQTDWDDFPRLFFYNTRSIYLAGLDPTYSHLYDPELYDTWVNITRGLISNPSAIIREEFGGEFVISDLEHDAFLRVAARDPGLREMYRDEWAVIWQVLPPSE